MSRANYHAGRHRHNHWLLIVVACVVLLIAGAVYGYVKFQARVKPATLATTSSSSQKPATSAETQAGHFEESLFTFEAPGDWQFNKHDTQPYNLYSYHGAIAGEYRYLDIYVDHIPQNLAFNRVIAVRPNGLQISHSKVSESCSALTAGPAQGTSTDSSLATTVHWEGVEFLCDKGSKAHNVIGTSAPGSINKVVLRGTSSGQHAFVFIYNDSVAKPNYTVFYRILESFKVK
jgi:hypothetical protein